MTHCCSSPWHHLPQDIPWTPPPQMSFRSHHGAAAPWPSPCDVPLPRLFPMPPQACPTIIASDSGVPMPPPSWFIEMMHSFHGRQQCEGEGRSPSSLSSQHSECTECALERKRASEPRAHKPRQVHQSEGKKMAAKPVAASSAPHQQRYRDTRREGKLFTEPLNKSPSPKRHHGLDARARENSTEQRTTATRQQPSATVRPERGQTATQRAEATMRHIEDLYSTLQSSYKRYDDGASTVRRPPAASTSDIPAAATAGAAHPMGPRAASASGMTQKAKASASAEGRRMKEESAAALLQPSNELRRELLKLESQWMRLAELQGMSHNERSGGGPCSPAVAASKDGASRPDAVMDLIRERRAAAADAQSAS